MIRGVVALSETTVKEVMVPRIDVAFVGVEMDPHEVLEKVAESGHSRLPAYRDTIDNVVGMLYAKDLLQYYLTGEEFSPTVAIDSILMHNLHGVDLDNRARCRRRVRWRIGNRMSRRHHRRDRGRHSGRV